MFKSTYVYACDTYYRAVGIAYLFLLFVLSVDSASGAFASNDEGAVMDTGGG